MQSVADFILSTTDNLTISRSMYGMYVRVALGVLVMSRLMLIISPIHFCGEELNDGPIQGPCSVLSRILE